MGETNLPQRGVAARPDLWCAREVRASGCPIRKNARPSACRAPIAARTPIVCGYAVSLCATCLYILPCVELAFAAQPLGVNIVVNGRGESGGAAANAIGVVSPPGWVGMGSITQVQYGASGAPFLNALSARPPDAGLTFFAGGPGSAQSAMIQRVELAQRAAQIDSGVVNITFSAWMGGATTEEDTVLAFCTFLDEEEFTLGTLQLNGPNSLQRGGVTLLAARNVHGRVPAGTRAAEIILLFSRATGTYNNGYADSVGLVLDAPCRSDINIDGGIDGLDVDAFFVYWVAADVRADFNADGGIDGEDVSAFFAAWEQAEC
jgi:hypothetical protein